MSGWLSFAGSSDIHHQAAVYLSGDDDVSQFSFNSGKKRGSDDLAEEADGPVVVLNQDAWLAIAGRHRQLLYCATIYHRYGDHGRNVQRFNISVFWHSHER